MLASINVLCEWDHNNSHLTYINIRLASPVKRKQNEELSNKVLHFRFASTYDYHHTFLVISTNENVHTSTHACKENGTSL